MESSARSRTNIAVNVSAVLCDDWCAFRNRPIANAAVTPIDCQECRSILVNEGTILCQCGQSWEIHQGAASFGDHCVDRDSDAQLTVIETDFDKDPRWNSFVKDHPKGLLFHHSLWLRTLKAEFGQPTLSLACVDASGRFQGILPLFYTRGLPLGISHIGVHDTGKRLSSLPRTPVAGPLASNSAATRALLREAVRRVRSQDNLILQLKVAANDMDGLLENVWGTPWRDRYELELPDGATDFVRFGNAKHNHKVTWGVNRARREGITTREAVCEEDLRQWYPLYLETMRRVVVPPRPYRFFVEMWQRLQPRGMMRLMLAEGPETGRTVLLAGSLFLMYGRSTHYAFTGCHNGALALHVNDLLQWEAIQRAYGDGFRLYDFGEVADDCGGLAAFKSKWCATPKRLYRYVYPRTATEPAAKSHTDLGSLSLMTRCWQRAPLGLTEFLGAQIYSHL